MKKLVSLVSLLLCILMIFASCGASESGMGLSKKKLSFTNVKNNVTLTELTSAGEGYTFIGRQNSLAIFSKQVNENTATAYTVVNLKTNTTVITKTFSNDFISNGTAFVALSGKGAFFTVLENTTYTLYKADGVAIGSAKTAPTFINDCAVIGDTVCRYDTVTLEPIETYTYSALNGTIPECTGYTSSNYYFAKTYYGFTVYDSHYKYLGDYSFPTYAENKVYFPLKGGKVLLQYLVALPFDATEYDIFDDGMKFDLVQKILNPKNLSEKDVELGYYVSAVTPVSDSANNLFFKKKIDNIATAFKIEGGQYDLSIPSQLSLNKNGKTTLLYDSRYRSYSPIGNGYFTAVSKTGSPFILDKKLNVHVKTGGFNASTEKYIASTTAIYDYNLTKLAELITDTLTYTFVDTVGANLIFSAPDGDGNLDYFVFDGAFNKIVDYSEGQRSIACYAKTAYCVTSTVGGVTTTRLYKSDKTEIFAFTDTVLYKGILERKDETSLLFSVGNKFYFVNATK